MLCTSDIYGPVDAPRCTESYFDTLSGRCFFHSKNQYNMKSIAMIQTATFRLNYCIVSNWFILLTLRWVNHGCNKFNTLLKHWGQILD